MPENYQAHHVGDDQKPDTHSQTLDSNLAHERPTVSKLLADKGDEVFSVRPQDTIHHAAEVLRDKKIGAALVRDANGALVGILSERDIVRQLADTPGETLPQKVEQVMTSKLETCTPGDDLVNVLQRMTKGRFRHMPVLEGDDLVGLISIGDVVNFRLLQLEYESLKLKQMIVG